MSCSKGLLIGRVSVLILAFGLGACGQNPQQTSDRPPSENGNQSTVAPAEDRPPYQALEDYLAKGQWREADQETENLIQDVAGKSYLAPEDIEKLPCESLQAMDQLWRQYSEGHFGFSVQKDLYTAAGNGAASQYNEQTFGQLGDRLGWRADGRWLEYDKLMFAKDAPKGHLPGVLWFVAPDGSLIGESAELKALLLSHQCLS